MSKEKSERLIFFPTSRRSWREWLIKNADFSEGVWVIIQKKNSDISGITYEEAVEEAVAFGWIDSKAKTADAKSFKQLFTPRKAGSIWSKSNKNRAEKLIREGLMTKTALEKIQKAKKDGSWYKLDKTEEIQIPSDLKKMLHSNEMAVKNFEAYSDSLKKQVIWWIESAKREETRKKRIRSAVKMAEENRKSITLS